MVAQGKLFKNWDEVKEQLRRKWKRLTSKDLRQRFRDVEQLTGLIEKKTGEGREAVEAYLQEIGATAASAVGAASERVRQCGHQAGDSLGDVRKAAAEQIAAGYDEARRFVRKQPGRALAMCFGAGLLAGLLVWMSRRA